MPGSRTVVVAAVVLAFTAGLSVGATALHGGVVAGLAEDKDRAQERATTTATDLRRSAAHVAALREVVSRTAPSVVAESLTGQSVVLLSAPGVSRHARDELVGLLGSAGATVTGELQLTPAFTDRASTDRLRDLAITLQPAGTRLPSDGDAPALVGALLGSVLRSAATGNAASPSEPERTAALSGLAQGGFLTGATQTEPARLAVLIGPGGRGEELPVITRFAREFDRAGPDAVLVSERFPQQYPDQAAGFSTVEGVHTVEGRLAAVLALGEQLNGGTGHYGAAGPADSLPPGDPAEG